MLRRAIRSASVPLLVAATVFAGGVGNVSRSPVVVHADLQAAIDAAADGDVLLVHGGDYSGFTLDSRSLAIFAVPGESVRVQGKVEIKNLPSSKRVVLSDLSLRGGMLFNGDGEVALAVSNSAGLIWIQGCTLRGEDGVGATAFGGCGATIAGANSVTIVGSSLIGGNRQTGGSSGGGGGNGVDVNASKVALYDVTAKGGHASTDFWELSIGGHGVRNLNGTVFVSNSTAQRGLAANSGSDIWSFGTTYVLDCTYANWSGSLVTLQPAARSIQFPHVAASATQVTAVLTGEAGDAFRLPSSMFGGWFLHLATNGVWSTAYPAVMPRAPLATLGATGTFQGIWTTPQTASGAPASLRFTQGYVLPEGGGAVLASPVCTLLLDVDALPDCDGNGVFDVLDLVAGATDLNQTFVPDACEPLATWYVDDSAAPGGDGSLAAPFQTLAAGVNAAATGETVIVLDGTYLGAGNHDVDFGGKTLIVRSQNGAASCVVDGQSLGRAFRVRAANGASSRIEGFTLRNGWASALSPFGGAIALEPGARATIASCVLECNAAIGNGGAIGVEPGAVAVVTDCSFRDNQSTNDGGGIMVNDSAARVSRCDFEGNHGRMGGAIAALGVSTLDLSHSTFLANGSSWMGGALLLQNTATWELQRTRASNLLFAGNVASMFGGGAIHATGSQQSGELKLSHSTIVSNTAHATNLGGGAVEAHSMRVDFSDCIVWQNVAAPNASQLSFSGSWVSADYCDIEGGSAGVFNSNSVVTWGGGNLDVDPEFVDADGMDNDPLTFGDNVYRLKPTSPCLDAGDAVNALADVTDIDGDLDFGEPVPLDLNLKPRFKDLPRVPDTGIGSPPIDLGCYERQS